MRKESGGVENQCEDPQGRTKVGTFITGVVEGEDGEEPCQVITGLKPVISIFALHALHYHSFSRAIAQKGMNGTKDAKKKLQIAGCGDISPRKITQQMCRIEKITEMHKTIEKRYYYIKNNK